VLRISAPGYRPVISALIDDEHPTPTWNAALKKTEPWRVRVLQPDGSPAVGAKIASNNVFGDTVRMERGDLPAQDWPDGNDAVSFTDTNGIAIVQPEDERFGFIVVHPTGWGRLVSKELPVLHLRAWASVEIDLNGLPPSLRTSLTLMRNMEADGVSSVVADLQKTWPNNLYHDDHLLAADYQLQLFSEQTKSAPMVLHLKPGEHRKLDAGKLWHWMKLQGRFEIPKGASLAKTQVHILLCPVAESGRLSNCVQTQATCEPTADGAWQITFEPIGLAAGTYELCSGVEGWLTEPTETQEPKIIGSVLETFTVTPSEFDSARQKLELIEDNSGQLHLKTDNAPVYPLPILHLK